MDREKDAGIRISYLSDRRDAIPVVASWIYREWSFLYVGKTRRYVEDFLRERLHKRKLPLTLVAFERGRPVGTVSLKEFDMEGRQDLTPWVTSLYVVPARRKRGIGAALMRAVHDKAARMGIRGLYLFTADPGLAAGFYRGLGWRIAERTSYLSYPVIIMKKDLVAT